MIKDGSGKGYFAKVDGNNRLWAYATVRSEIAFQSEYNQSAFMVSNLLTLNASGSQPVSHISYSGNKSCHIDKIIISSDSNLASVDVILDTAYVSGGTILIPQNINLSSNNSSNLSAYCNTTQDLSFTYDITKSIAHIVLSKSTYNFELEGGFILRNGNQFSIIGEIENPGSEQIRVAIYFYEEEDQ